MEKTLESPMDSKEISTFNPKGTSQGNNRGDGHVKMETKAVEMLPQAQGSFRIDWLDLLAVQGTEP